MRKPLFHSAQSTQSRLNKPPPKSNKDKDITEHDRKCAQDLASSLTRAGRVTRIPHVRVWSRAFRDLRKINKIPDKDVVHCVQWYCAHVKDQYTPLVCSAEQFRTKYPAIVEAMLRYSRDNPDVIISEAAQRIVKDLTRLKWPSKVVESLPAFVQLSLDNLTKLLDKMEFILQNKSLENLYGVVRSVINRLPPAETYIKQWWEQKFPLLKKFPKTRLDTCVWSIHHKDFTNVVRAWIHDYCGRDDVWFRILQEIVK